MQPARVVDLVVDGTELVHVVGIVYDAIVVGIDEEVGHAVVIDVDVERDIAVVVSLVQRNLSAIGSGAFRLRHGTLHRGGIGIPLEPGQHQLFSHKAALQRAAVFIGGDGHAAGGVVVDLHI